MRIFASIRLLNHCMLRHSCRNIPEIVRKKPFLRGFQALQITTQLAEVVIQGIVHIDHAYLVSLSRYCWHQFCCLVHLAAPLIYDDGSSERTPASP